MMHPALMTFAQARDSARADSRLATLVDWVGSYPVAAHDQLGRGGPVCPFTERARRMDTLRFAVCTAGPGEEDHAFRVIRRGFHDLERIPVAPEKKLLRAVIVGFPNCDSAEGIAMLRRVDRRHKYYALLRLRTIGFMHPHSDAQGVWNPDFRPMQAPMPVMIVRCVVEQDAPFIAHHRLSLAPYLLRYGLDGARRIHSYRRRLDRMRTQT